MSKIDDDFASQPDDVRQSYFVRALNWYFDHGRGQPSLPKVKELAATLWFNDEFVKPKDRKKPNERSS